MNWSVCFTPHALSLSPLLAPPFSDIEQPLAAILPQYLLSVLVKWSDGYQQRALVVLRRLSLLEAREALMKAQAKVGLVATEDLGVLRTRLVVLWNVGPEQDPLGDTSPVYCSICCSSWKASNSIPLE